MKFILTKHAKKRLEERNIPNPKSINLNRITRKIKKKVRESCKREGCDIRNTIYFCATIEGLTYVYVCKQKDIGVFYLLTALLYY